MPDNDNQNGHPPIEQLLSVPKANVGRETIAIDFDKDGWCILPKGRFRYSEIVAILEHQSLPNCIICLKSGLQLLVEVPATVFYTGLSSHLALLGTSGGA